MIHIDINLSYLELYIICVNIFSFVIYGIDKLKALNNKKTRRISENTLFFLVFVGGNVGAIVSMFTFRHKIKKLSFMIKYILIIAIQILGYYFYLRFTNIL